MSDLVARAKKLAAKATPGPWVWTDKGEYDIWGGHLESGEQTVLQGLGYDGLWTDICAGQADAAFIAVARELVPSLAIALEEAEREKELALAALEIHGRGPGLCRCAECGLLEHVLHPPGQE